MARQKLTPEQYITELNRRLQKHEEYRQGMAFVAYPDGSSGRGMSGYSITGPFELTGIYAQVAHEVAQQFDLQL